MKNIKARYFFIAAGVFLLLAVGTVILIPMLNGNWNYFFIVLLVVFFILTTFSIQIGTRNLFVSRNSKKIFNTISFTSDINFKDALLDNYFQMNEYKYGFVFKKMVDKKT